MLTTVQSIQQRHILAVMCFIAVVSLYLMRISLAISMTQMVKPIVTNDSVYDESSCPVPSTNAIKKNGTNTGNLTHFATPTSIQIFEWTHEQQGHILSAFYIGYVLAHIPCGLLAERFGGKPVILLSIFLSSLLSIATPMAVVRGGAPALFIVRVLLGFVQAGMFTSTATLLAIWIPKSERARVGSLVYCAGPFGAIIGNSTAGFLMHYYESWHVSFYAFGVIGIIVGILYAILCASSPDAHPFIGDAEKEYLQKELGQLRRDKNLKSVPWRAIYTSKPVIALVLSIVLGDWAYYSILIDLPKYMNDVLHVSVKDNGVLTSLPWAMFMIVSLTSGFLSDRLIASGRLSITNTRKLLVTISCAIGGAFIMAAAYVGCDISLVGTFFTIAVGAQGFQSASIFINAMDLCPNYAAVLTGVIGTFACCMGVIVPVVISFLTPNSLQSEWRIVFWITLAVSIAQILIFDIWGSADVQPWNSPQRSSHAECSIIPEKYFKTDVMPVNGAQSKTLDEGDCNSYKQPNLR